MTLFASTSSLNWMMTGNTGLINNFLKNHPIYLTFAFRIKCLLSSNILPRMSSNFSISVELVRIPCTSTLYVGSRTDAPFPIL
jgi:hypothetical protein